MSTFNTGLTAGIFNQVSSNNFGKDIDNNKITSGQYYQTNESGSNPLNVPGILMVKQ